MLFNSGIIENSEFGVIKGYTSENELNGLLTKLHNNKNYTVFAKFNCEIESPTYDEATLITSIIPDITKLSNELISRVINKFFYDLPNETRRKMMMATELIMRGISQKPNATATMQKNYFVKLIKAYDSTFLDVLASLDSPGKKYILYSGKMNDYYVTILSAMYKMGVSVLIFSEQNIITPIPTPLDYFEGDKRGFDDLANTYKAIEAGLVVSTKSKIDRSDWAVTDSNDFASNLTRVFTCDRLLPTGNIRCLSIGFTGVYASNEKYSQILSAFYSTNQAKSLLVEGKLDNPTFDEVASFNNLDLNDKYKITEYLETFKALNPYAMPIASDFITQFKDLPMSDKKIYFAWLMRLINKFYKDISEITDLPIIILYGAINVKTRTFIKLLYNLPIDIIHFCPDVVSTIPEIGKYKNIGNQSRELTKYPILETQVVTTLAYNAEQEIQNVLYNDDSLIYKYKQYKHYNLVRIRTTYDEIGMLWDVPFKLRSGFETVKGVVTAPSFFVKVMGVSGTRDEYLESVKSKLVKGTVFIQKRKGVNFGDATNTSRYLGCQPVDYEKELPFLRQLWFSKELDKDRLLRSAYWHYGRFSEETRNLLLAKMEEVLNSSMLDKIGRKEYPRVLSAMLNIDTNIINLAHQNDYTGDSPKIVVFDGTGEGLSLEESVQIMYLNALCFDVLVYAPTGYVTIENYIPEQYYDTITIGKYEFDYGDVDINTYQPKHKQNGFLSSIFGNN